MLILLLSNLILHWPSKKPAKMGFPGPGGAPGQPSAEMRAQFEEALQKLPEDQRAVVTQRMEDDRAFFDSVKALSEQERQQKIQEHMAQNPPPQIPGMPAPLSSPNPGDTNGVAGAPGSAGGAGNGSGGPGGGGPESGHIPEPTVRHSMDQNIANSQQTSTAQ